MSLTAGFWVLAVIGVLGELSPLVGGRRGRGSIYLSACTSLAILLAWGFWPALAAQTAASIVAVLASRLRPARAGLLIARAAAATGVAAAVLAVSGLDSVRGAQSIDRSVLLDLILAILAWLATYYGPVIFVERWVRHESWRTVLGRGLGAEVLATVSLLFLAPVVVAEPRGWTFALLALPLLALIQLSGLVNRQAASLRHDRLTGLPNQRGLAECAVELGRQRRRVVGRYAVLLIRLQSLRDLDDAFGRPIVDAVLAATARRLATAIEPRATVGRPDTDDLVVLVPRTTESGRPVRGRTGLAVAAVNRAVEEPVVVDGLPYDAAATIGIARSPEEGEDLPSLLRHADAAIRYGQVGPDSVAAHPAAPQEEVERRLSLLTDLDAALRGRADGGDIAFVYQPQVRLDTGLVVAVEALLRWTHPTRGAVSPDDVLRVAEPTPLMQQLTRLAVETVIDELRQWNDLGFRLRAAVNVSMRDLHQGWLIDEMLDRIGHAGVADQLVMEITESEVIKDPGQVSRTVDRLAGAGIRLAVDDFGSGFASLQHLRQLRLNQLKIDKGLIGGIAENAHDRAVVRSVIELGQALGLVVVAEGVMDQPVHRILRELGCPMGQGWFYGRPVPGSELVQALSQPPRADRGAGAKSLL